ncbi:MAG: TerB family tellurite resistance protein [Microcystis aeruginosa]
MKNKQLLKILIGVAWIDGVIQPSERSYLRQVAVREKLDDDLEIKPLLSELKPVKTSECYRWLESYLGANPSPETYQDLLTSISTLIYSDDDVDIQEAKLLTKVQSFDPTHDSHRSILDKLVTGIQKLYHKAITENN